MRNVRVLRKRDKGHRDDRARKRACRSRGIYVRKTKNKNGLAMQEPG